MNLHSQQLIDMLYLLAAVLFIVGLKRLGSPKTARSGNTVAGIGMGLGLGATFLGEEFEFASRGFVLIVVGVLIGSAFGVISARSVKMTAMPQMVAFFNGVGGGCVGLISLAEYHHFVEVVDRLGRMGANLNLEGAALVGTLAGAVIGTISFSGSVIAFLKLQEVISGRPVTWPLQKALNAVALLAIVGACIYLGFETNELLLQGIVAVAFLLGMAFVLPIGGADMPVVISLLNSFTGIAACMAGLALDNSLLIIAGIIVGASGFLLTKLMGEAMNRPISNVLFGGFGAAGGSEASAGAEGTVRVASSEDVAIQLAYARQVVIVPGYGMAVAQAQHATRELVDMLGERGVTVKIGIHPVAGRMPGHMKVLLAEANVPYDQLREMDEVNPEFRTTDVVLVIGANDVVNPAAREDPSSPLYGMPILNVDEAASCIVLKRSMRTGYAGVDNPLFLKPNTQMLFGDAKESITALLSTVKEA